MGPHDGQGRVRTAQGELEPAPVLLDPGPREPHALTRLDLRDLGSPEHELHRARRVLERGIGDLGGAPGSVDLAGRPDGGDRRLQARLAIRAKRGDSRRCWGRADGSPACGAGGSAEKRGAGVASREALTPRVSRGDRAGIGGGVLGGAVGAARGHRFTPSASSGGGIRQEEVGSPRSRDRGDVPLPRVRAAVACPPRTRRPGGRRRGGGGPFAGPVRRVRPRTAAGRDERPAGADARVKAPNPRGPALRCPVATYGPETLPSLP